MLLLMYPVPAHCSITQDPIPVSVECPSVGKAAGCEETCHCCYQALGCLGYVAAYKSQILVLGCVTGEVLDCEGVMNAAASWEKAMVTSWANVGWKGGEQVKRQEVREGSE
jgi:hypothetical protein